MTLLCRGYKNTRYQLLGYRESELNTAQENLDERLALGQIDLAEHKNLSTKLKLSKENSASEGFSNTKEVLEPLPMPEASDRISPENLIGCPNCSMQCIASQTHCLECGSRLRIVDTNESNMQKGSVEALVDIRFGTALARFGAWFVDLFVVVAVQFVVGLICGVVILAVGGTTTGEEDIWQFLGLLVFLLYFSLLDSSGWQGTVGKRVFGLRIVDTQLQGISFGKAFGRTLGKILSSATIVGLLMPLWTQRKQALHDFMSSTMVVKA